MIKHLIYKALFEGNPSSFLFCFYLVVRLYSKKYGNKNCLEVQNDTNTNSNTQSEIAFNYGKFRALLQLNDEMRNEKEAKKMKHLTAPR